MENKDLQIETMLKELPAAGSATLDDTNAAMQKVVDYLMADNDQLHRLMALKNLAMLSCAALAKQNMDNVEKRLTDNINTQIANLQNAIRQKNEEYDKILEEYKDYLSGVRQHENMLKQVVDSVASLEGDNSIGGAFSNIDKLIAEIEGKLKDAVKSRQTQTIDSLTY